ncbi:MAG: AMP-binding protein [Dehalococcoidia bacterium]
MLQVAPATIRDIIEAHDPLSLGLVGETATFTRQHLCDAVASIASGLASHGIGRSERIAIVVENGPGAVIAFIGSTLAGVAAPLNPA